MPSVHVPDGFLDVPTSIATGAIAVGAVGLCLRRAERELVETGPALAGLTAAFVLGAQMVNFPVGVGTSGHLLGGALAAALVGPWTAVVVMTAVVVVQALLFADGGLTALGTNVLLIAVIGTLVGHGVTRALLRLRRRRPAATSAVTLAAAAGAGVSVPAAALGFTGLFLAGGTVDVPAAALTTAMLGWHLVIGLGEAAITAAVLTAVAASRPDLVHAMRGLGPRATSAGGARLGSGPTGWPGAGGAPLQRTGAGGRRPLVVAGLVTLVVAGGLSLLASGHPDGLESVAGALGFGGSARASAAAAGPLADYTLGGSGAAWGAVVAGVAGVVVVGLLVVGLLVVGLLVASVGRAASGRPRGRSPGARREGTAERGPWPRRPRGPGAMRPAPTPRSPDRSAIAEDG